MKRAIPHGSIKLECLIVFLIIALFAALSGATFLLEVPLRLLGGWIYFLQEKIPKLSVSPSGLCLFGILVVSVCVMIYQIGHGLASRQKGSFGFRSAVSITLTIIALFGAGIGATGVAHQTGWLLTQREPWIKRQAHFERFRTHQRHRNAAIAIHRLNTDLEKTEPQTMLFSKLNPTNQDGERLHGWQTPLLPYLNHQSLYEQIALDHSWRHDENAAAVFQEVDAFLYPSSHLQPPTRRSRFALSHVAGNRHLLGDKKIGGFDGITDGLANTVLSGSVNGHFLPWAHPQNYRGHKYLPNEHPGGFGGPHHGGCHITMADGSVRFIPDSIDPQIWRAMFTPAAADQVEEKIDR